MINQTTVSLPLKTILKYAKKPLVYVAKLDKYLSQGQDVNLELHQLSNDDFLTIHDWFFVKLLTTPTKMASRYQDAIAFLSKVFHSEHHKRWKRYAQPSTPSIDPDDFDNDIPTIAEEKLIQFDGDTKKFIHDIKNYQGFNLDDVGVYIQVQQFGVNSFLSMTDSLIHSLEFVGVLEVGDYLMPFEWRQIGKENVLYFTNTHIYRPWQVNILKKGDTK